MRVRGLFLMFLLPALLAAAATVCVAQPPVQAPGIVRLDLAGLYSKYSPGGTVNGIKLPDFSGGVGGQVAVSAGRWTSVVADVTRYSNNSTSATGLAFGLQVHKDFWRMTPYGEAMAGLLRITPKGMSAQNTPSYIFGGGVDVRVNSHFSLRPIDVSYVNAVYNENPAGVEKRDIFHGARIQVGLVYHLSFQTGAPVLSAQCLATPAAVTAGQTVTLKVQAGGVRTKKRLIYSYSAAGGTITENGDSATVDTTGLADGSYHAAVRVENPNDKGGQVVRCETSFQVGPLPETKPAESAPSAGETSAPAAAEPKPEEPKPAEAKPEEPKPAEAQPVTAPAAETKPAEAASVAHSTAVAADVPPVKSAPAAVAKAKPAKPADAPAVVSARRDQPRKYGSVFFHRDVKRPERVDNEAKGALDRFADLLAASPELKAVVVGSAVHAEGSTPAERTQRAAQRAVNTKHYLSQEKGIDPQRIEVRTGSAADKAVELWLLPPGTTVPERGTARVDEERVKAIPRVALRPKGAKPDKASHELTPKPAVRGRPAHKSKWHEK